jgi:hypothetical protein
MSEEHPFDEIHREISPKLVELYKLYGFETFFVFGRSQSAILRMFRRGIEELRWNRWYLFLRAWDKIFLFWYKYYKPKCISVGNRIDVDVPEDLRHLSVKILCALDFLINQKFNVVIRTTASSILNPRILRDIIESSVPPSSVFYGGRKIMQADGFNFVSGSFTIFNARSMKLLELRRKDIDFSLIDDVSFGRIFQQEGLNIHNYESVNISSLQDLYKREDFSKIAHYRCRTGTTSRNDVEVMSELLTRVKQDLQVDDV